MKKRILSIIICLCIILSAMPVITFSEVKSEDNYYIDYLRKLGIFDETYPEEYEYITRGQMAVCIETLLGGWMNPGDFLIRYNDVEKDSAYSKAIEVLSSLNIIAGYTDGNFYPDKPVEHNELIKVLIGFLGYTYKAKINGGYPSGYLYEANNLGLLSGITVASGPLDAGTFAHYIYNAIDIDIAMKVGVEIGDNENYNNIEVVKGRTIMTEYLDLYKGEGIVYANSYASIKGHNVSENQLLIDNLVLNIKNPLYNEYLGRAVSYVYHMAPDSLEKNLVLIEENKKKNITSSFVGANIFNVNGLELKYEGKKGFENISISPVADIMYNFEIVVFNKALFENSNYHKYEFIDNNGDKKVDFIYIEKLDSIVAGTTSKATGLIIDKYNLAKKITINDSKYSNIILVGSENNPIKFEDISDGDTITYAVSSKVLKCYVSNKTVAGRIISHGSDGQYTIYDIDGVNYKKSPADTSTASYLGKNVNVYIDTFGFAAYVSEFADKDGIKGYLLDAKPRPESNGDNNYIFSIYSQNQEHKSYFAAERVRVNGVSTKIENLPASFPQTPVLFGLDDEGKVNMIETPVADEYYTKGRMRISFAKKKAYNYNQQDSFDQQLTRGSKTVMFSIVQKDGVVSKENIKVQKSLAEREFYTVEGYTYSEDGMVADIILIYQDVLTGESIPNGDNVLVVDKIRTVYDESDECSKQVLTGLFNGAESTFTVSKDYIKDFEKLALDRGDVIRYAVDNLNEITKVDVVLDLSKGWEREGNTYPQGAAIDATLRFAIGRVVAKDSRFIRYIDPAKYDSYSGFLGDCIATKTDYMPNMTVIEINNSGKPFIRAGNKTTDVEPGDFILEYATLQQLRATVVIKGIDSILKGE